MPAPRPVRYWVLLWVTLIGLVVLVFLVGGIRIGNAVSDSFASSRQIRIAQRQLFDLFKAQLDEETGLRGYVATGDASFLEPFHNGVSALPIAFADLTSSLRTLGLPTAAVDEAHRSNAVWLATVGAPLSVDRTRSSLLLQRKEKALVDTFRRDSAIVEHNLTLRGDQLRSTVATQLLWLQLLIVAAAAVLLCAGLAFVGLSTRAFERTERARRLREQAAQRENALRTAYEKEKHTVDALQQVFSGRLLPQVQGVRFSAVYRAAAQEEKVGGDWFDAVELGPDRVLVVIGDVAGHGLEAAAAMSRLRDEVFAAGLYAADVESIVSRVNARVFTRRLTAPMVTLIVGIVNTRTCEVTYAAAGHPPPILVEPGRPSRLLAFGGVPLGVLEKAAYRPIRLQTQPGAMLVLYTDGAVEYSKNIIDGERMLMAAADAAVRHDNPAQVIYTAIFRDRLAADDVAILTVEFAPTAGLLYATSAAAAAPNEFQGRLA